jgi:CMP/dCMP kinase
MLGRGGSPVKYSSISSQPLSSSPFVARARKKHGESLIVTIDGPAGAGKSSVAKRLAKELGFAFLDTGAMYRCVTLACMRRKLLMENKEEVAALARQLNIQLLASKVMLDGEDVTESIRTPNVTKSISAIANNVEVRDVMVEAQRRWSEGKDAVTEGRDQGTVAFPSAECKIFLTASPEVRAHRRVSQLIELGIDASFDEILENQKLRDDQDTKREKGGLRPADDAITVWTDGMTEKEVLKKLVEIVRKRNSRK